MSRRWVRVVAWAIAIVQIARVSVFMVNNDHKNAVAIPSTWFGFYTRHSCYEPYIMAGAMARQGAKVYDLSALDKPDVHCIPTEMIGSSFAASLDCHDDTIGGLDVEPYEYPPPFLLLPRAGLALSDDFFVLRTAWYLVELASFVAALLLVARFARQRTTFVPIVLASLPVLLTLQIGNFQIAAFAWAMIAMLWIEDGLVLPGATLLAFVTLSKIFPGVLGVMMIARRQWRALGWTIAAGVGLAALAYGVLGPAPFREFWQFQLPRLQSGEAFPWVEHSTGDYVILFAGINFSPYGLVKKLQLLGVPGMGRATAQALLWAYGLAVLAGAYVVGRRLRDARPFELVLGWLGILTLASLRSPFAPNVYVAIAPLWLAALLLEERVRGWLLAVFALLWVVVSESRGDFPSAWLAFAIATAQSLATYGVCIVALRRALIPSRMRARSTSGS